MNLAQSPLRDANRFRVLIVEDEALVSLEMQIILVGAGFDVVGVTSTLAGAVQMASIFAPQLAIVDVNLANGDNGLDVAVDLKKLGIPALFSSGNCPDDPDRVLAIGCLHKPFDDQSLTRAVQTAQALIEQAGLSASQDRPF